MKNLIISGTIQTPAELSTIILLDNALNTISPDSLILNKTNLYEYTFEVVKSVADGITDDRYYIRVLNEIYKCYPITYNNSNVFNLIYNSSNVSTDKTWLTKSPLFFKSGISILKDLSYAETSTQNVVVSGDNVTEWFNYSSGSFTASSSLNIGSGILYSFILKKKNSSLVNSILISHQDDYIIEIIDDVLNINGDASTLVLTETFQLFSIWFGPISAKTWLNNVFKETLTYTTFTPTILNKALTKQFIGYELDFGIFNTAEPSLNDISYLLESSKIKGNYKITGELYINNLLSASIEVILLDKNYYKVRTTTSDNNGIYTFNDLFYDDYYIISAANVTSNIILGPVTPIPQ